MTSKAFELAKLGNAFSDGALSNRNAIINGEFSVSQRGDYTSATVMTDNAYTLDRWKTYRGAGSATFQDMGGSLKLTATSAYSGTLSIRQHVEWVNLSTRVGQTFTLSAYMKTTSSNARLLTYDGTGWSTGATPHSGSGDWEIVTFTFTMPDASSYGSLLVAVGIDGVDSANVSIANGESVEIKQVQLEVGDTATPFEHEPYSVTLQKCQRYFFKMDFPQTSSFAFVHKQSTDTIRATIVAPQVLRSLPSINGTGQPSWGINYEGGTFSNTNGNGWSIVSGSLDGSRFVIAATATGVATNIGGLYGYFGDFLFDAEL